MARGISARVWVPLAEALAEVVVVKVRDVSVPLADRVRKEALRKQMKPLVPQHE